MSLDSIVDLDAKDVFDVHQKALVAMDDAE
jgi:hypothetical protein